MDYNKLKTFAKVAQCGSITLAAAQMFRSQSAISQQIQLLEEELELKLLERKGGRVYLSRHGEQVLELVHDRLLGIDEGILELKAATNNIEGNLRIGVLNDYGTDINYGRIVGEFCRRYPNVNIELVEGTSTSLERILSNNDIDLSFQVYFQNPEMVIQIPISKTRHSLYTSPKYIEANGPFGSHKQVIAADLIDLTNDFICIGTYIAKNAPNLFSTLKHRQPTIAAPNHEIMRQIVCSSFGIAILPDYFVAKDLKAGRLIKLMPGSEAVYAGLDLAYRTNKTMRLVEREFIKFATKFIPVAV
jgi:DNA-binding transcriptional LysR family regulator